MALILSPGTRVWSADGTPVSGALVRIYEANTTTPAAIYSDTGLTVPLTNPVVTNSAGYPSASGSPTLVFGAAENYDIAFLTPGGAELVSFQDAPAYGEGSGDFERTVSGLGRIKITGAAGAVYIQAGSPTPDNVGGDLTLEGQGGTQLDALTIDSLATNLTGNLTVSGGKRLAGIVETAATTFTTASTVDIPLTESPDGVRGFCVDIFDLVTSASIISLAARLSYDNGATFKSGAADYGDYAHTYNSGGTAFAISRDDEASHYPLNGQPISPRANSPVRITIDILTADSGSLDTLISHRLVAWENRGGSPGIPLRHDGGGYGRGGYGRATHIRLFVASGGGTLTGKYRVVPLRGFGE
jgi:hypothetical protein